MKLPENIPGKLPLSTKLACGVGAMAFGITSGGFGTLLLLFYNQVIGMPAGLVGAAIMIALVADAAIDPIVGQVSDNWKSRLGRRHPFMYAAAVPVALSYMLLWNPPTGWSTTLLFVYIVIVAVVIRTFITMYEIPSTALVAELTTHYDDRTSILGYRTVFNVIGGSGMTLLAYQIFLRPTKGIPLGQLNPQGYSRYGIAAALLMLTSILISAAGTHHRIRQLRQPAPPAKRSALSALREMISTLSNRSFLAMLGAAFFVAIGGGIATSLSIYFWTYYWELSPNKISILLVPSIVGAMIGATLAPVASRHFGKKAAGISLLAFAVTAYVAPIVCRLAGIAPQNGSPWLLPMLVAFSTVNMGSGIAALILIQSMIADVVEASELKTGRRSEGLFFSANAFVQKAISGTGIFFSGLVLAFARFPSHAKPGHVEPEILFKLGVIFVPAVMLCYAAALVCIGAYKITRASHEDNVRRLEAAVATAEAVEVSSGVGGLPSNIGEVGLDAGLT